MLLSQQFLLGAALTAVTRESSSGNWGPVCGAPRTVDTAPPLSLFEVLSELVVRGVQCVLDAGQVGVPGEAQPREDMHRVE